MAQILDTQVASGGAFILDTQESGSVTSTVLSVAVSQANNTVAASASVVVTAYTAAVAFTQANNTVAAAVSTPTTTDQFSARVRHKTTGAALTGLTTVTLRICHPESGLFFDFSDNSFKASPATSTFVMTEVSATHQPGLYRCNVQTTNMDGWVDFETTYYDGAYTYAYPGSVFYSAGRRSTGMWSSAQQTQVSAIQSAVAAVPSAVLSAAVATPIYADARRMNGANILGDGSGGNKWRGQ